MTDDISPLVKSISLNVSAKKAFQFFTENIHQWWPLDTHSLGQADAKSVVFEAKDNGRIYEISKNGVQRDWGIVSTYAPFSKLVFSWVLEAPDDATEVEVNFESDGPEKSRLTLIHRGWNQRSDGATWRANYDQGWEGVLPLFKTAISQV